MQTEPDFRATLERLQSCRSVRDALDILQQITDAKMDLVIPATREDVDLIVREFEERLRQGENPSDVDLSSEVQEELKRFLDSFILPEHKDGPKEDEIARQLSRQISEEKEKEMKIIASRLGRTFLNNTSSEEDSGEGITAVKIKGGETVSETDIKFGSLVEPLDPVPTALAHLVSVAPKETFKVETAAEGTTNEEEFLDLQKQPKSKIRIFSDRQQFEHYIKSHIDPDAFSWRIIEGVAEFVVLSLHVLFGTNRIIEIQNEGGDVENLKHLDVCRQLYQNFLGECKCGVDLSYNGEKVGETKRALYKQGEQGDCSAAVMDRSGIEIALVKMDHEEKVNIDFADSISDQWNKLVVWGACNHSFHNCCMTLWVKQNNRCPLCQQDWVVQRIGKYVKPNFVNKHKEWKCTDEMLFWRCPL
ncbi:uncharacterized protein LOC123556526 isoform X2 [Mercenaria mercenaria]|uniref:uncharacterized protein LOC123556526 isoform X2 n=1 Tax=Mercenaria mercenaria TaxID=6596 RepID=UPI00234F42AE|nr:uncharacterized protein LOC123556526 isoform X2 [Mercenaria mercenaria]